MTRESRQLRKQKRKRNRSTNPGHSKVAQEPQNLGVSLVQPKMRFLDHPTVSWTPPRVAILRRARHPLVENIIRAGQFLTDIFDIILKQGYFSTIHVLGAAGACRKGDILL
jgi:hypothetical protein